ncbi:putative RNase H-like nuclease [Streptomyces sp. SLBN-118]|nr:putative RNase H-like nuclease [Streptomyces sp. SLBN-118]
MVTVLGVDACPAGWVAVELRDGRFEGARLGADLRSLLREAGEPGTGAGSGIEVVGVDIPLGLLDVGWRLADTEAAALLGKLRGSVFRVPPHAVWQEEQYEGANRRCRELTGAGLSRQTWGLAAKLREANGFLADAGGDRLFEVHPEVSFWALAGSTPLPHRKKSWAGQMARRSLLKAAGIVLPDDLGDAGRVPPDDVLDAAAAAWSAHRIAQRRAHSLPDPPQHDCRGRPIAIWY